MEKFKRAIAEIPFDKLEELSRLEWKKTKRWILVWIAVFVLGVWVDLRWLAMLIPFAIPVVLNAIVMDAVDKEMERRRRG